MDALATPVIGILADKYSTKKIWHLLGKAIAIYENYFQYIIMNTFLYTLYMNFK